MSDYFELWNILKKANLLDEEDAVRLHAHVESNYYKNLALSNEKSSLSTTFAYFIPPITASVVLAAGYITTRSFQGIAVLVSGGVSLIGSLPFCKAPKRNHIIKFKNIIKQFQSSDEAFFKYIKTLRAREIARYRLGDRRAFNSYADSRIMCLTYLQGSCYLFQSLSQKIYASMDTEDINLIMDTLDEITSQEVETILHPVEQLLEAALTIDNLKLVFDLMRRFRSEALSLLLLDVMYRFDADRDLEMINALTDTFEKIGGPHYANTLRPITKASEPNNTQESSFQMAVEYINSIADMLRKSEELPDDSGNLLRASQELQRIFLEHQNKRDQERNLQIKIIPKPEPSAPEIDSSPHNIPMELEVSLEDDEALNDRLQEDNTKYQVFEGTSGTEPPKSSNNENAVEDVENDSINDSRNHGALLNELRAVLKPRRDEMMQQERSAIAHFRRIPVEDVEIEEVEEAINKPKMDSGNESSWLEKPFVYTKASPVKVGSLFEALTRRQGGPEDVLGADSDSD